MGNKTFAALLIFLCAVSIITGLYSSTRQIEPTCPVDAENVQNVFKVTGDKIALISLDGEIIADKSGGLIGNIYSAEGVKAALKKAMNDATVKGVLLRINSPGGTVAMSQEIYDSVLKLRNEKPVVVSMADVAASGGYYIAAASDRIFAEPGSLTGSIGVIMNTFNAQDFLGQKLGITSTVIKSGKYKDLGSPYRAITPDEKTLLQNLINSAYHQFFNAIVAARIGRNDVYSVQKRTLTKETLKKYADGRILTGEQAYKLGFIDQLGGMDEAQSSVDQMAKERFGIKETKELPMALYNRPTGFSEFLFNISESVAPKGLIPESITPKHSTSASTVVYVGIMRNSSMSGSINKFLDNFYGVLFTPAETFENLKQNPPLFQSFFIVLFVSILSPLLNTKLSTGAENLAWLSLNLVFSAIGGLISWWVFAFYFETVSKIFNRGGHMRDFLALSGFALLPWVFLAPIELLKTGFPASNVLRIVIGLLIWLWVVALVVRAVAKTYDLSTRKALVLTTIPFLGGILAFNWFIGFWTTLFEIMN